MIARPKIGTAAWASLPVLAYGFRTFFLLAAMAAVTLVAMWLAVLLGLAAWPASSLPAFQWHAHEMVFGFIGAAIAGFLLTAVPSWTGTPAIAGARLGFLALLWLGGRIASMPAFAHSPLAAAIDVAFLPMVGALLAASLFAAGKLRNTLFLALLAGLAFANLLMRLEWLGVTADTARSGTTLAVGIVLLMVTVIGGRIVPAFTQNALRESRPEVSIAARPRLDSATIMATILMVALDLGLPQSAAAVLATFAAALLHGLRMAGWKTAQTRSQPLLWVLHLAYAWIPVALALKVASSLGLAWASGWLHALGVGAFTSMILAVSSRAALGHTGRPLAAARPIVAAFALVLLAALLRTSLAGMSAALYVPVLIASGLAWLAAFLLWLWVYVPILFRRRPDDAAG